MIINPYIPYFFFENAIQAERALLFHSGSNDLTDDDLLPVGDIIGDEYKIMSILGKGGFGIVYLVESMRSKELFAFKTLREIWLMQRHVQNRFIKEIEIWIGMGKHPCIVQGLFIVEHDRRIYFGMQYIEPDEYGINTLAGHLARDHLSINQILRHAIQICYGMEHAYSKGMRCHRDIKPENIMIAKDGYAKISDFGLAGTFESIAYDKAIFVNFNNRSIGLSLQTINGMGFGTPQYMAPEQFHNAQNCDERSDIYSFGIVLYQMITRGTLPFGLPKYNKIKSEADVMEIYYKLHIKGNVPPLCSPIHNIVQSCLKINPAERYSSFNNIRLLLQELHLKLNRFEYTIDIKQ